jgi:acetyltransferase
MSGLDALFAPHTIAVLGVSRDPGKLGHRLLQNIRESGFAGAIYPVHPSGESILGYATTRSVDALPDSVDLALLSLPASAVPAAVKALAARRAKAAVVLSSGFGEVDDDGRTLQDEMLTVARAAGLRLVGPNCMGVYSAPQHLNATYFWDLPRTGGGISIVSQSGAYGGLIFRHLGSRGLGVARFLSIGNQADVDIAEVVEWLLDDPATTLIACFVEALKNGRRFVDAAGRATVRKPLVVLKGGRSAAGRRAAGSHTGALAGGFDVYRAACRRSGAVLAEETEEFFDAIETLVVAGDARASAPRIAIITVSGGPAVVAADCAEGSGVAVPSLTEETRTRLRTLLPAFAAVGNPVDLTPQVAAASIGAAVRAVFDEPLIAGAVVIDVGLDIPELADAVVAAARATAKPAVAFVADAAGVAVRLRERAVPVLPSPERAVRAWRALWLASPRPAVEWPVRRPLDDDVAAALRTAQGPLPYPIARRALEAYGVSFCREAIVETAESAVTAAESLGYPVVVKADVAGLIHKTDKSAVKLGLSDPVAVRHACHELGERLGAIRFVVQEQVSHGVEVLIGGRRDEVFGPVVAVGVGGVLTEVVRDVSWRLAPLDREEARLMLHEGARERLLAGPRGLPACDDEPLLAALIAVGELLCAESRVLEVDLNPVIAAGPRAVAVDALVIVGDHV